MCTFAENVRTMKRTLFFTLLVAAVFSACNRTERQYNAIVETLNLSVPLELENIAKAHDMIIDASNMDSVQVAKLQELFINYIYANADMQQGLMQEAYSAALNTPNDTLLLDSLENVMDGMRRYGLLMYASEGEIIAHTMPAYIAEAFDKYLTPSERDMIRLTEIEVETPSVTDEGVIVTNEELAHRLKLCDDMLAAYPNDQMTAEIKACQEHYLICLLLNADNQQDSTLQQTIEAYVESYPDAASTPLLQQFLEIADQPNADHKKFIEQNILNN